MASDWLFNDSTAVANPGSGQLSFDNADPALATSMLISNTSQAGDASAFLDALLAQDVRLVQTSNQAWRIYQLGAQANYGAYRGVNVTLVDQYGVPQFPDGANIRVEVTGAAGGTGPTGPQGATGPTGPANITSARWRYEYTPPASLGVPSAGRFRLGLANPTDPFSLVLRIHIEALVGPSDTGEFLSSLSYQAIRIADSAGGWSIYSIGYASGVLIGDYVQLTYNETIASSGMSLTDGTDYYISLSGQPGPTGPALGWPALAPDGSAAAPSYSFGVDSDTGVFRRSTNSLGFATGGQLRASLTHNVGYNVLHAWDENGENSRAFWNNGNLPVASGSWTPVLQGQTTNPTVSYNHQSGSYFRVGNLVFVQGIMETTSLSGGGGSARIGGLPFAVRGELGGGSSVATMAVETNLLNVYGNQANVIGVVGLFVGGTSQWQLQRIRNGQTVQSIQVTDWADTGRVRFGGVYYTLDP